MQVIDLSQLPDTAFLVTDYSETFGRGTSFKRYLQRGTIRLRLCGTQTTSGVHYRCIDPSNRCRRAVPAGYYIHDCHVRDTPALCRRLYNGTIDIVSIADKSNPSSLPLSMTGGQHS